MTARAVDGAFKSKILDPIMVALHRMPIKLSPQKSFAINRRTLIGLLGHRHHSYSRIS